MNQYYIQFSCEIDKTHGFIGLSYRVRVCDFQFRKPILTQSFYFDTWSWILILLNVSYANKK